MAKYTTFSDKNRQEAYWSFRMKTQFWIRAGTSFGLMRNAVMRQNDVDHFYCKFMHSGLQLVAVDAPNICLEGNNFIFRLAVLGEHGENQGIELFKSSQCNPLSPTQHFTTAIMPIVLRNRYVVGFMSRVRQTSVYKIASQFVSLTFVLDC